MKEKHMCDDASCQHSTEVLSALPNMAEYTWKQWRLTEEHNNKQCYKNTITKRICFISWALVKV